jgi:hypothetical protein
MKSHKINKTRQIILKKLNEILLLLIEEGMSDSNTDEQYKEFLSNVGVVLSTFCLAVSMEDEYKMVEILDKFNLESVVKSLNISCLIDEEEDCLEEVISNLGISKNLNGKHNLN